MLNNKLALLMCLIMAFTSNTIIHVICVLFERGKKIPYLLVNNSFFFSSALCSCNQSKEVNKANESAKIIDSIYNIYDVSREYLILIC